VPEAPPVARPKSSPAAPPSPPAQAPHTPSRLELGLGKDARPERSWEERLGPVGIAVFAIVACAIAWFVTYKFF